VLASKQKGSNMENIRQSQVGAGTCAGLACKS
jgi:hypothetical protein